MPQANDRIGPYTLIRQLGRGAYGVVWLAERRTTLATTKVAIKLLSDSAADLDEIARESQVWAQAGGHPNVLPIIEADVYDDHVAIVSEYAPDGSLADWMIRHGGRAPSLAAAVQMTAGILDGLEHLHARRIVHRDLKPANILLLGEVPRLADFGLARVLKTGADSSSIAGTPAYMAPETFDGRRSVHSDIWAVGLILYQLLSGAYPFPRKNMAQLIGAICNRDADPLPATVPEPLREVVERALKKEAHARYASASEMRAALARAYEASPVAVLVAPVGVTATGLPFDAIARDSATTLRSQSSGRIATARSVVRTETVDGVPATTQPMSAGGRGLAAAALAVILAVVGFYAYSTLAPAAIEEPSTGASTSVSSATRSAADPEADDADTEAADEFGSDEPSVSAPSETVSERQPAPDRSAPPAATDATGSPAPGADPPARRDPAPPASQPSYGAAEFPYAGTWEDVGACPGSRLEIGGSAGAPAISGYSMCGGPTVNWTGFSVQFKWKEIHYFTDWNGSRLEGLIHFTSATTATKKWRMNGKWGSTQLRRVG